MQVKRKDLNPCTIELQVICSADQVKDGLSKATKYFAKRVKVPGFRPGQAPPSIVENLVNPQELLEYAANAIVRSAAKSVLEQEKIEPYEHPHILISQFDKDELHCEFTMKAPLAPIIELSNYKGLNIEKPTGGAINLY